MKQFSERHRRKISTNKSFFFRSLRLYKLSIKRSHKIKNLLNGIKFNLMFLFLIFIFLRTRQTIILIASAMSEVSKEV